MNRNRLTDIDNRPVVAKAGAEQGQDWELGVSGCKLLHRDWMKNKTLLYDTGNYIQYSGINHNGRDYNINNIKKKESIYMYN